MNQTQNEVIELDETSLAAVTGGEEWFCTENECWDATPGSASHVWWYEGSDGGP